MHKCNFYINTLPLPDAWALKRIPSCVLTHSHPSKVKPACPEIPKTLSYTHNTMQTLYVVIEPIIHPFHTFSAPNHPMFYRLVAFSLWDCDTLWIVLQFLERTHACSLRRSKLHAECPWGQFFLQDEVPTTVQVPSVLLKITPKDKTSLIVFKSQILLLFPAFSQIKLGVISNRTQSVSLFSVFKS